MIVYPIATNRFVAFKIEYIYVLFCYPPIQWPSHGVVFVGYLITILAGLPVKITFSPPLS